MIRHPEFERGFREMLAPSLGIAAWGLVTGVAMVKSGLSVPVAALMTVLVYAGSAQLAALPLIVAGAPLWVVLRDGVLRQLAVRHLQRTLAQVLRPLAALAAAHTRRMSRPI